ncbi:porin family protein [Flavivirga amylovorans]|uniref:Porin family protein n=1 Tax=Flavivirga amylovorans TaxID=870486 RepID=A0ABT8X2Z2_9FLAO|nr:porin family protein [Flavivirga amylovorans]MDO5988289.1 porin family protein [Flavivirga amylovorans]
MKRLFFSIFFLLSFVYCFTQEINDKEVDSLYKEDQFYAGVTYNLLGNMRTDVSQSGFSLGFHLGFIKDMPINKDRNVAIGIGLGYSANSFNHNILINRDNTGAITYSILRDGNTFIKNKFSSHLIELPIEFRWRTSTATEYNFWRIYTGFKLGYVFAHTTKYRGDLGRIRYTNIEDFNNFQYGLTLSAGYNTWNIFLYYALNPIFSNNANLDERKIDMNAIKIGLMFYIL